MYAIVDIAGQQLKVEKNQKVYVHRLDAEEGSKVDFDKVLLIDNDGKIDVGTPIIKDMVVSATVVGHLKGDKVKVFKKKRRKGYQVLNGHRQYLTEILIEDIAAGKASKKAPAEKPKNVADTKSETKTTEEKTKVAKENSKKASEAKEKPAAQKKATAEKKPVANKSTASKTTAKKSDPAKAAKPATKKSEPKEDKSEE